MNQFKLYQNWSNLVEKETETAISLMGEAFSASMKVLNTAAMSGAEMYRHAKVLHKSRQEFLKLFTPIL